MNVLAFDTCFDACSAAAGRGLETSAPVIAKVFEPMQSGQAERLIPMIEEALHRSALSIADLDHIAVTAGPGTFTGTRITTAAARALALLVGTPLVTVSSLHLMALNARATGGPPEAERVPQLAIATDARRGEVYWQTFDPQSRAPTSPPQVTSIATAAQTLHAEAVVAGSGGAAVAQAAQAIGKNIRAVAADLLPNAADLLLASLHLPRVSTVHALYLRPADAKPQTDAALART